MSWTLQEFSVTSCRYSAVVCGLFPRPAHPPVHWLSQVREAGAVCEELWNFYGKLVLYMYNGDLGLQSVLGEDFWQLVKRRSTRPLAIVIVS